MSKEEEKLRGNMADFKPFIPKEQKLGAGAYCKVLWQLLPEIKRNIEESPTEITSISINDFKKKLGTRYEPHSLINIEKLIKPITGIPYDNPFDFANDLLRLGMISLKK